MATAVKAQVMCKLNQVPKHRELPDKRIEFFLADGDRVFTVKMKPKMFKKLTEHGFTEWVASITGDLGPATETGFELENASLQVFEKKAKAETDAKPEAKTQSAVARPPAPKVEAKPQGKKSLLDGVKMR
jgi:sulfite reductase alpha subunit-like flavoprotein